MASIFSQSVRAFRATGGRVSPLLRVVLCLLLALPVFFGCSKEDPSKKEPPAANKTVQERTPPSRVARTNPIDWELSPEAEHLCHYLLLTEGLSSNNTELIVDSIYGLLKLEHSLAMYQDAASILYSRQSHEEARDIAAQGLGLYPGDKTLTAVLAGSFAELGDARSSIGVLEEYSGKHPEDIEIKQEIFRMYISAGETEKAQKLLDSLDSTAQTAASLFFQGRVYSDAGDYVQAERVLRKLAASYPEFPEAWIALALNAEKQNNSAAALEHYQKAATLLPESDDLSLRIVRLLLQNERVAEAVRAASATPGNRGLALQASALFADEGHFTEAEELVRSAVRAGASEDEAALYFSNIYFLQTENVEKALAPLRRVREGSPFFEKAAVRTVQLLMQDKDPAKALATAATLRKKLPGTIDLWGLEAYALARSGKADAAETLMLEAVTRFPDNENALFHLATVQDEGGKKAEALATMESILALNPDNPRAQNYVGYTLAEENRDLERALQLVSSALEQMPDADYIVDSLAWVYFRLGKYEEAWQTIQQCIGMGTEDVTVWEHYGDIALAHGKKSEARKGYTEALKLTPDSAILKNKLENLKSGKTEP